MASRGKDDPFQLNANQIRQLIKLARFKRTDIFYDLGSGKGTVVIGVARKTGVKKSIGIETQKEDYETARTSAIEQLTKQQLKRVDFWYGNFFTQADDGDGYYYGLADATIVYLGVDEDSDTIDHLRSLFGCRHVKIITKNLPLVGFQSVANRSDSNCWLFLMHYPLKRIRSMKKWAHTVKPNATMEDIYEYYVKQIEKQYPKERKYAKGNLLTLKKLVNDRF